MAFTNTSRSFSNLGAATTAENKTPGNTLNANFANANHAWGSSSIWGGGAYTNGLSSRVATRDNSTTREGARQTSTSQAEFIEGKTGSGSLVDSSVSDDWNYKTPWGSKRSLPSARSVSQAKHPETSSFQQRSVSNAGLPNSFSSAKHNVPQFTSRPAINLNTTSAQSKPTFTPAYSSSVQGRGNDQPPNVYTKFDRPADPNARKLPDSAKEGLWSDYSPTDERKSAFPNRFGSKTFSTPGSRDGSKPSSQQGGEQPFFATPDYSRNSQRPTQNNSRAPSLSSQSNGRYSSFTNPTADQLALQLHQLNMNGDSRPPTHYRPSPNTNGMYNQLSPLSTRAPWNSMGTTSDTPEDLEDFERAGVNYIGLEGYASSHQATGLPDYTGAAYNGRLAQTPTTTDFKSAQPFSNGTMSNLSYDAPTGPRSDSATQSQSDDARLVNQRLQALQEQSLYMDPRMQQMLASQLRNAYAPMYSPYAMPSPIQLGAGPYGQLLPMNMSGADSMMDPSDALAREGVQSALMYDFKSNAKSKRYELKDIYDHIAEFSGDQHGSRFIQTKLETANSDEKERVFREIEPNAIPLMTDVFGNYVIQKFFEHGDQIHKKILANKMKGQVLTLSLQMYGCRVVQKALDHVLVDQQAELIRELESHVLKCVKDQNGNHVIQKAIERCPPSTIEFIIGAFQGQVQHLSIHPYGCRVIQRCLERCDSPSKAMIMAELVDGIQSMISDQYGNYVVQHVVEHDDGEGRRRVLDIVSRGLEAYSKHKFASNVVEKCLEKADDYWRRSVVFAIANGNQRRGEGEGVFVSMIKDSYGNYVIQKLLDTLCPEDYMHFLDVLQPAVTQAKRTGCGKQVLSIEKKMHRFPMLRNGPTNGGAYNPNAYQLPLPTPPFASHFGSAATTPPPLTADSQSLQSSAIQSINGDAVEGAAFGSRKGSELSNDGYSR
ncbi:mRNA binding protein puf3 [Vermiconidia calcicola]|uniref:mRNA binding protein puf3 n=1 Tax=Vermiconidia calcicola TaxID=1690605 RepID=A0ACC3N5F5_9PEZI|nr:mRNA binding protein puf3 [Vermiconidia calcicola]